MESRLRFALTAICVWIGLSASLHACDTPVYRYAMYRWPASKYYVFFIHQGDPTKTQAEVNQAIREMEAAEDPKPNVVFFDIPVAEMETAPPIAAAHWKKIGKPESTYIVVAPPPLGNVVYDGPLTLNDVRSMVASPLRTEIANHLEGGAATVFLLLEADEKAKAGSGAASGSKSAGTEQVNNKAAREITKRLVEQVNAGRITLYATPKPGDLPGAEQPLKPEHKIATVRLSRDNPDEQWLIRMLLAVESDLPEFNQPMVFPVYGRGRVHPPFLGLGVTEDNLTEAVQFVTGACSCTVKEQNPGVDLLFDYDWEAAAIAMAEKFGAEEGNEQLGAADLFPQLIIPGESGSIDTTSAEAETAETTEASETTEAAESQSSPEIAGSDTEGDSDAASETAEADSTEVASTKVVEEVESAPTSLAFASIWAVAGVLIVAVAGLFIATLVILRPR